MVMGRLLGGAMSEHRLAPQNISMSPFRHAGPDSAKAFGAAYMRILREPEGLLNRHFASGPARRAKRLLRWRAIHAKVIFQASNKFGNLLNMEKKAAGIASFVWDDPFLLEDQLSEDERMIRDAAAAFAGDKLAPRIETAYAEEKTDPAIFREMGEAGLLGITVPEEYGGLGTGYVTYGLVARERKSLLARLDGPDTAACAICLLVPAKGAYKQRRMLSHYWARHAEMGS
jgi:hypothetical protein